MEIHCVICGQRTDTKKEDVIVTASWILEETLKKNNVNHEGPFPRVCMICSKCWNDVIKNKPEDKSCFWIYNKEI